MTATNAISEPGGDRCRDKCMVHDTSEIRRHLQRLLDARCVLVGQVDGMAATQVTALLRIDGTSLLIDVPRSEAARRDWLENPRLLFRSSVDRISIRFVTGPAWLDSHDGRPALGLPIPAQLLYEQRREYLRIAPPMGGLRCRVPAGTSTDSPAWVDATIRDIGGGGLALLVPGKAASFAVGDLLEECAIELPHLEPVTVTLLVRHLVVRSGHGPEVLQAGCEFVDLSGVAQDKLFRYLMRLDRERVSRLRAWE